MLTLLCAVSSTFGQEPPIASFAHAGRGSADAVKLLLSRTLPGGEEVWNDFELEIVRIYIFIHNIFMWLRLLGPSPSLNLLLQAAI